MSSGDALDAEHMSTEILEYIHDVRQSPPSVNRREAQYNICYCIKLTQTECKGALLSTWNMGKVSHKVFESTVNEISQVLPLLGESGSEVAYFIP